MANRKEEIIMGMPILKSSRLFFMLATLIGMPNETRIGISMMAAPTPPSEKTNAEYK